MVLEGFWLRDWVVWRGWGVVEEWRLVCFFRLEEYGVEWELVEDGMGERGVLGLMCFLVDDE